MATASDPFDVRRGNLGKAKLASMSRQNFGNPGGARPCSFLQGAKSSCPDSPRQKMASADSLPFPTRASKRIFHVSGRELRELRYLSMEQRRRELDRLCVTIAMFS